jgi:hypothetical protein
MRQKRMGSVSAETACERVHKALPRKRHALCGMSTRLTTTPQRITMQAAMAGAFMIVDSFGHY